eukprot:530520-Heterocapsa_arctica.AAC.1
MINDQRGEDIAPPEVINFIVNAPAFEPCSTVVEKKSKPRVGRPDLQPSAAGAPRGTGEPEA